MIDRGRTGDRLAFAAESAGSASFERFYRENYRSVVRLATTVLGDANAAQDVAQEVFIAAHDRFRGDVERAPGWVRVAAVHSALNVIRGDRRRERRHWRAAPADPATQSAEDVVIDRETRRELRRALAQLPDRSATVLVLRHGGMSYSEVAEAMGINVGQVGTLLRRAELALAKEMGRGTRQ